MKTLSKANFALRFSLILAALCLISLEATRVLADPGGARTVKYSQQDIIPVRAKAFSYPNRLASERRHSGFCHRRQGILDY
jgi:hypothetical protein